MPPHPRPTLPKHAVSLSFFAAICTTCFAIGPDGSCPLLTMIPFSDRRRPPGNLPSVFDNYGYGPWTPKSVGVAGYTHMAAALLAMDHFNARDASIVPELSDPELATCDVFFPSTSVFVDSSYDKITSVTEIMKSTQSLLPCAIIGPGEAKAVEGTGIMSASLDIPQMAYMNMEPRIGNKDEFPTVVRTIVEQHPLVKAVTTYLQREGKERNHVAILHNQDENGMQFARAFKAANETNLRLTHEEFDSQNPDSIVQTLKHAQGTGYHTIVLITEQPAYLPMIAEEADKLGLIGEDYFWIFSGTTLPPEYLSTIRETPNSPLDRLLRGAAIFRVMDGFAWDPNNDKFLASWRELDGSFVERLNDFYPLKNQENRLEYFEAKSDFFQDERYRPSEYASFVYDSVIAVGIGACRSQLDGYDGHKEDDPENLSKIKNRHVSEILKTRFQGASGGVKFQENDGSRDTQGVMYGIYNIRAGEMDLETGENEYDDILTAINNKQRWEDVKGETFLFFNGKPDQPMPLIEEVDANFLSPSVQAIGLFLMSLSLAISLVSIGWVWYMRKERSIQAAQPLFLYLICFGSIMMTLTNLTMSFDESYGLSAAQLGTACNIKLWLFVLGYIIMYAALFSKLARINRIFQFRRQKVNVHQVLGPFAFLLISSIILLTVWTVGYTMEWKRKVVTETPLVTYGECEGRHVAIFVVPTVILMVATTILTGIMAWRTKDIQAEFSESNWIFYGICTQIQAWVVGLPVIIILGASSADAYYIGKAMMFFIFSVSIVVLVIWPKMIRIIRKKLYGNKRKSNRSRVQISPGGGRNVMVSGVRNSSIILSTDETHRHSLGSYTQGSLGVSTRSALTTAALSQTNGDQTKSQSRRKSVRFSLVEDEIESGSYGNTTATACQSETETGNEKASPKTECDDVNKELVNLKVVAEQKSKLLDDALDQVCKKEAKIQEKDKELNAALSRIALLEKNQKARSEHTLDYSEQDDSFSPV